MEVLNKNLSYIKSQNIDLFSRITALTQLTKTYDINTNLKGEYNLLIDGKPVHSVTDIASETDELLQKLPGDSVDALHFIYGIGLGYLADKYLEKNKGYVIVYEEDIETLYFVLSAVDFSENFNKGRFFIISNMDELISLLDILFKYKSKATLSVLDYYNLYQSEKVALFKDLLKRRVELRNHNISFVTKTNFEFFKKTLLNIDKKYNHFLMSDYKNVFKNVPALIASAGPSLSKNIETIKKYQDNALIFCGGTSVNTLYNNGIIPDFLNVIERHNTLVHYDLPCTEKINFITEPFADSSYLQKSFNRIFYTASLESDDARWYLETAGKELIPYETKGTVAYHAIYTAYYLGCNPIILIGQDLAYSDSSCYAKGSVFDELSCVYDESSSQYKIICNDFEKFKNAYFKSAPDTPEETKVKQIEHRIQELNDNLKTVKGQNGESLPTDSVYALFIDYIQDFATNYKKDRTLINSSVGGAMIEGFDVYPLDEVFTKFANKKLDKSNIVDSVDYKNTFDKSTVCKNLKKDYETLAKLSPLLTRIFELSKRLKKELVRAKIVSSPALELNKKIIALFSEITKDYFFSSRIGRVCTFRMYIEIEYLLRVQLDSISYKDMVELVDTCVECFEDAIKRLDYIFEYLDIAIKNMEKNYEICNSKG